MKQKKPKNEEFVKNREFSEQLVCNGRKSDAADKSSRIFVVSIYRELCKGPSAVISDYQMSHTSLCTFV